MYKIETSVGDIYFNLDSSLVETVKSSSITFCDDGLGKLKKIYKFDDIEIIAHNEQYFLQIWVYDDYYGIPEYRIISKEEQEQVDRLKERIKYSPGNERSVAAQTDFESLI